MKGKGEKGRREWETERDGGERASVRQRDGCGELCFVGYLERAKWARERERERESCCPFLVLRFPVGRERKEKDSEREIIKGREWKKILWLCKKFSKFIQRINNVNASSFLSDFIGLGS